MKVKSLIVCCLIILVCFTGCEQKVDPPNPQKTEMEMVTVLASETTINGTTVLNTENPDRSGVFLQGRNVTLSPYEIGKYEVTQKLYKTVMNLNPSFLQGDDNPPASGETQELRPVEGVTWYDAVIFCNELTKLKMTEADCVYTITNPLKANTDYPNSVTSATVTQNLTKKGYRLPTEAEWECAARGGAPSTAPWNYTYSGSNTSHDVAWIRDNSQDIMDYIWKSHEVGKKAANSLEIFDMSGNVCEWCWDLHANDVPTGNVENPLGASEGSYRVLRGGSWNTVDNSYTSVSRRSDDNPSSGFSSVGFRVCRSL